MSTTEHMNAENIAFQSFWTVSPLVDSGRHKAIVVRRTTKFLQIVLYSLPCEQKIQTWIKACCTCRCSLPMRLDRAWDPAAAVHWGVL